MMDAPRPINGDLRLFRLMKIARTAEYDAAVQTIWGFRTISFSILSNVNAGLMRLSPVVFNHIILARLFSRLSTLRPLRRSGFQLILKIQKRLVLIMKGRFPPFWKHISPRLLFPGLFSGFFRRGVSFGPHLL